jgi:hypothetical protein
MLVKPAALQNRCANLRCSALGGLIELLLFQLKLKFELVLFLFVDGSDEIQKSHGFSGLGFGLIFRFDRPDKRKERPRRLEPKTIEGPGSLPKILSDKE